MKRFLGLAIGLFSIIGFTSSAEAITITLAEVQNGVAVVQGNKAAKSAIIAWDGLSVTQTSKGGSFSFSGPVPADCVGTLSDGVSTIDVVVLDCTPVPPAFAPVPRTGQTTSYAAGDDGALQKGVAWPSPRFTVNVNAADDNGAGGGTAGNGICDGAEICNGTVTDNLTGLTWPRTLHCVGGNSTQTWGDALAAANALAHGNVACGLTDGSAAGDWRLPNRNELASLLDLGTFNPALPAGHPFLNFVMPNYWSSTRFALPFTPNQVWFVNFVFGIVQHNDDTGAAYFVTAVRDGS